MTYKRLVEEAGRYWMPHVSVRDSSGPVRVETDKPDPEFKRRPVGFLADLDEPAPEHEIIQEPPC